MEEYLDGLQNEVYRIPLEPHIFHGIGFMTAALQMYQDFNIILIAVEVDINGVAKVFVNPADYVFQDKLHYGYVIASELPDFH